MPSFNSVFSTHPWRPIPGCPGRYQLGPPSAMTPEALLGDGALGVEHRIAAARDPVVVLALDGGGLISYRKPDGTFVHTLGDASGFSRKLEQLGIVAPAVEPVRVEFIAATTIFREPAFTSGLPIVGNGPPGTFVRFPGGAQVPLPTDQIVAAHDAGGAARVTFGGFRFDGIESGQLVFLRVRDLWPEEQLSPERGRRMTLEPWMVAAVFVGHRLVWPTPS